MFQFLGGVEEVGLYRVIDAHSNGVQQTNSAAVNATALQALINANTAHGAIIYFAAPIACDPITLKSGVHLVGNNGFPGIGGLPDGGGSPPSNSPTNAAFLISDTVTPFITMQSDTSIEGFIFTYSTQNYAAANYAALVTFPPTIVHDSTIGIVSNLSVRRCCFVGCTQAMKFVATFSDYIREMEIDLCYGYGMNGRFMELAYIRDIPRVTRCHVIPSGFTYLGLNGSQGPFADAVTYTIITNDVGAYEFRNSDEIMVSQCFAYAVGCGFKVTDCYGVLENCAVDQSLEGFNINLGTRAYDSMVISNARIIPSALGQGSQANRVGIVYGGSGGYLKVSTTDGFVSGGSAGAMIRVNGSSTQRLSISQVTSHTADSSSWTAQIDQVNGSASVTGSVTNY